MKSIHILILWVGAASASSPLKQLAQQKSVWPNCFEQEQKKLVALEYSQTVPVQLADHIITPDVDCHNGQEETRYTILSLCALCYCAYRICPYVYNLFELEIPYVHQHVVKTGDPSWLDWSMKAVLSMCPLLKSSINQVRLMTFCAGTAIEAIVAKTAAKMLLFGAQADMFDLYEGFLKQGRRTVAITKKALIM